MFSYLCNGAENRPYLLGFLGRLSALIHVNPVPSAWHLRAKDLVSVSCEFKTVAQSLTRVPSAEERLLLGVTIKSFQEGLAEVGILAFQV